MDDISYMDDTGYDEVSDRRGDSQSKPPPNKRTPQSIKRGQTGSVSSPHSTRVPRSNSRDSGQMSSQTTLSDSQSALQTITEHETPFGEGTPFISKGTPTQTESGDSTTRSKKSMLSKGGLPRSLSDGAGDAETSELSPVERGRTTSESVPI